MQFSLFVCACIRIYTVVCLSLNCRDPCIRPIAWPYFFCGLIEYAAAKHTPFMTTSSRKKSRTTKFRGANRSLDALPEDALQDRKGSRGVKAYDLLRSAIATGKLKPGDRVLESELAALLKMSRTPVREAIALLETDGLVSLDNALGKVVTKLDYQSVMELYAVREVLESTAA